MNTQHLIMSSFTCSCVSPDADALGTRWAILIGIDNYPNNGARPDLHLTGLNGCVNDVRLVETFLCESTDIDSDRIHKLTSPRLDQAIARSYSGLPTYDNIVKLFRHVTKQAKAGDLVYIHYSGHGARVKSIFHHLKQQGGNLPTSLPSYDAEAGTGMSLDEALVTYDVGQGGRYLRDVELVVLLGEMAIKGLLVTTVLDCCHSGGMHRGNRDRTLRGIPQPDLKVLETDRSVRSVFQKNDLQSAYLKLHGAVEPGRRAAHVGEHWLFGCVWPGQVLLAACGAREEASEVEFDNESQGVFTHCLVEELKTRSDLSCREVHHVVSERIQDKHEFPQTPFIAGDENRRFFRGETSHLLLGVKVNKVAGMQLNINPPMELLAGSIHGVQVGDVFDVWHRLASKFDRKKRIARILVQEVSGNRSQGILTDLFDMLPISIGSDCIAAPVQKYRVRISPTSAGFSEVANALYGRDNILVSTDDNVEVDLIVTKLRNGNFHLQRGNGAELEHRVPRLTAVDDVLSVLDHISRYYALLDLEHDQGQEQGVSLELGSTESGNGNNPALRRRGIRSNDNINDWCFNDNHSYGDMSCNNGSWVVLRVRNNTDWSWKIAVMLLGSSWEVEQMLPKHKGGIYEELGPRTLLDLPIQLTKDYHDTKPETMVFKVFFSRQPVSFRWMELPKLRLQAGRGGVSSDQELPQFLSFKTLNRQPSYVCQSLRVSVTHAA